MKAEINARIKYREEFRPFAPSVLEESAHSIYNLKQLSPYMTVAVDVKKEWGEKTPATTHVNGTARVQTVDSRSNFLYHSLITNFEKETGIPLVLNTSFNIKGQPIVEDPLNAISTFAGTGLDSLIIGNFLINKENNPRMRYT
jgi:carbamoyltransferase